MKLNKINLAKAVVLNDRELKNICGGDAISVLCYVGKRCELNIYGANNVWYKYSGTCQGSQVGNITTCYCSVGGIIQGDLLNTSGYSHCTKGI